MLLLHVLSTILSVRVVLLPSLAFLVTPLASFCCEPSCCFVTTVTITQHQHQHGLRRHRKIDNTNMAFHFLFSSSSLKGKGEREEEADIRLAATSAVSRKERKAQERRSDYEQRRALWEQRYGSVEALRKSFGRSSKWGDLDPEATRQLYHSLLPRSLLGLHEAGLMNPAELAPLAYQARVAAKEYARERCILPARVLTQAFDGYRSFRRHGTFQTKGLSWEQLWDKYEAQIVEEECAHELKEKKIDEDALTTRIYLRILERSCATNKAFDRMFLKQNDSSRNGSADELGDLATIAEKLESDVRELLLHPKLAKKAMKRAQKAEEEREKAAKKAEEVIMKEKKKAKKAERKELRRLKKESEEEEEEKEATHTHGSEMDADSRDADNRRIRAYSVLRILVKNRQKKPRD